MMILMMDYNGMSGRVGGWNSPSKQKETDELVWKDKRNQAYSATSARNKTSAARR
jgi:hypothetical protein